MKKFISITKTILILSLAALAVFQISRLWLVNITNRNFFVYLQARFPPAAPDGQSAFVLPFRIVYGTGDGRFNIRYGGIAASDEWEFGERILRTVLQRGDFVAQTPHSPANRHQVLQQAAIIYEYAFDMSAGYFAQALGQRSGATLTEQGINTFNAAIIHPLSGDSGESAGAVSVFFINEHYIWEFSLAQQTRRQTTVNFYFDIEESNPYAKHFVLMDYGFVPNVPRGGFHYSAINVHNPYRDERGQITQQHIRSRVAPLFDNPATIMSRVSADGIFIFSDRHVMVRYLENHVLEYTSYRTIGRTAPDSFLADFSAALAFVADDDLLNTENMQIYLRNHAPQGRANVFFFNYVFDNHPLILLEPWQTGPNCADPLQSPIEVVVDNGRVIRYRRLVHTFERGGIAWMPAGGVGTDGYFSFAFPINNGPNIELAVVY